MPPRSGQLEGQEEILGDRLGWEPTNSGKRRSTHRKIGATADCCPPRIESRLDTKEEGAAGATRAWAGKHTQSTTPNATRTGDGCGERAEQTEDKKSIRAMHMFTSKCKLFWTSPPCMIERACAMGSLRADALISHSRVKTELNDGHPTKGCRSLYSCNRHVHGVRLARTWQHVARARACKRE